MWRRANSRSDPSTQASGDWKGFTLKRREQLRTLIVEVYGGNVLPFSGTDTSELEVEEVDEFEKVA
jgi:hypothetical protein